MADAIVEQILADWTTTLAGISTDNGFLHDFDKVERWHAGDMAQDGQIILEVKQGTVTPSDLQVMGTQMSTVTIQTLLKVRHDPAVDGLSSDTVMNRLEQDLYKAVMADPTRTGLAETTRYLGSGPADLDDGTGRVIKAVEYAVDYRHSETDMSAP
ncbi:MAG: hypothetical protein AB7T38_02450 [Nitrospirales bacterium]